MMQYENITGIILSGGKSSRMGLNKSFLRIGDQTIIDRVIGLMKSIFQDVLIITNEPGQYKYTGLKIYEDIYKNIGPIAGIHSGLTHSETQKNFIISCDLPLMNATMIESIIKLSNNYDITIAKADEFIQQLCGVYQKSVLPIIEKSIQDDEQQNTLREQQTKRKCNVHNLLNLCNTKIIENIEELDGFYPDIFFNMNTIEDYNQVINS